MWAAAAAAAVAGCRFRRGGAGWRRTDGRPDGLTLGRRRAERESWGWQVSERPVALGRVRSLRRRLTSWLLRSRRDMTGNELCEEE